MRELLQYKNIYFNFYRPQRSCGQGNIFTPVCHSFCSQGGVCLSACWDTTTPHPPGADPPGSRPPWEQTPPHPRDQNPPGPDPPGADTPRDQTPAPVSRLQHTVNERPVHILLECILVFNYFRAGSRDYEAERRFSGSTDMDRERDRSPRAFSAMGRRRRSSQDLHRKLTHIAQSFDRPRRIRYAKHKNTRRTKISCSS